MASPEQRSFVGNYRLTYEDGDGVVTRRKVIASAVERDGDAFYLIGYCELRRGERTFRTSRILELVDLGTSEVIVRFVGEWLWHEAERHMKTGSSAPFPEAIDTSEPKTESLSERVVARTKAARDRAIGIERFPFVSRMHITYENSKGRISARLVDVEEVVIDDWRVSIVGFCHEQKTKRTFHAHRIRDLTVSATNERVMKDFVNWLRNAVGARQPIDS